LKFIVKVKVTLKVISDAINGSVTAKVEVNFKVKDTVSVTIVKLTFYVKVIFKVKITIKVKVKESTIPVRHSPRPPWPLVAP